jgi:hypothetical protein
VRPDRWIADRLPFLLHLHRDDRLIESGRSCRSLGQSDGALQNAECKMQKEHSAWSRQEAH